MLKPKDDSGDSSMENEAVIIIDRWLEAISSFYEWHSQLNRALETNWARTDLRQLRLNLIEVLYSLKQEMELLDEGANTFVKLQHLSEQTKTLVSWNKTIQNALGNDIGDA